MKKKKVVLLGGLILVLGLGFYVITWAALDVGNDLNFRGTVGTDGHEIMNLKNPSHDLSAATWGYVQDAVNGNPGLTLSTYIGIWRQDGTSHDVYLNSVVGSNQLSGNVGIGTNDPEYLLDLRGAGKQYLQIKSTSVSSTDRGAGILLGDTQGGEHWQIYSTGTGTQKPLDFLFCTESICEGTNIRFTPDGFVGIGTMTPQERLHVRGNAWVNNNLLVGGFIGVTECGAPGTKGIRIGDDSYISDDNCSDGYSIPVPHSYTTLYITSGDDIAIKSGGNGITNTNYGIHIKSLNGDVGIGSTTIAYKLDVAGTGRFTKNVTINETPINSDHAATIGYVNAAVSPYWTASGNDIYNSNSGNVGIGTTSPSFDLHVFSSGGSTGNTDINLEYDLTGVPESDKDSDWVFRAASSGGKFHILNPTTERLTIDSGGSVGINDTTPSYKLDVNGTGRFTESVGIGGSGEDICDSNNAGRMHYYDGVGDSNFRVCMRTGAETYVWQLIKNVRY